MKNYIVPIILLIILIINVFYTFSLKNEIKNLECDINEGIIAEREYTYPILRELGFDPNEYGIGIKNPMTSKPEYNEHCF